MSDNNGYTADKPYTAVLPLAALRAALLFAAGPKVPRRCMAALHLEADHARGARVTAADGHAALRVHLPESSAEGLARASVLLEAAPLDALLRAAKPSPDALCRVTWAPGDGETAAVTVGPVTGTVPVVRGHQYPDVARVIPAHDGSAPAAPDAGTAPVDWRLLRRVADARVLLGVSDRNGAPYFAQHRVGSGPILCDVGPYAVCVVMPYRRDEAVPATDELRRAWVS